MFTKQQLVQWREQGFEFDSFHDSVAVDAKPIVEIKFISVTTSNANYTINVEFITKNIKSKTATISLSSIIDINPLGYAPLVGIVNTITITKDTNSYSFTIQKNPFDPNQYKDTNFKATLICDGITAETKIFKLDGNIKGVEQNIKSKCFCFSQGIVEFDCSNKGATISDEMYVKLADSINVDEGVLFAIAKQETKKESFIQLAPKKATILLERHYVYNLLKKKFDVNKANECQKEDSSLCNSKVTMKGGYGKSKEQLNRLEKVKKWDNDIAIKSCSWGKFQVMGVYIEKIKLYKDADEFEKAMNLCEVQHFQFFKSYLIDIIGGDLIKAMKEKNWEKIAELYNGKYWKKINPDYATNLKKYYEEYNN